MNKYFLIGAMAFAFVGCKTSNNVANDSSIQTQLRGSWTLTKVDYSKDYKVTSFHVADAKCFEGSKWDLVANNNRGVVSLNTNRDCPEFTSNITWNIKKDGTFNFKFIGSEKAKHVNEGYSLDVTNVSTNSFTLVDRSTEAKISYTFVKN